MKENQDCHLLRDSVALSDLKPVKVRFECLKVYTDESHLYRYLLSCKQCGQLYFYEFYEEIDWVNGNDPQYTTYIPVKNVLEAEELNKKSQFELCGVMPRLRCDYDSDGRRTIEWIR